jgi:hypothetical protein
MEMAMVRGDIGTQGVYGGGEWEVGEGFLDKARMAEALGLTQGEHLMIWTLRRLVARKGLCPLTLMEFTEICGEGAPPVLAIFQSFLGIAGQASRRHVSVGYPGYVGLTADERNMVALIGAAQAEAHERLAAHLLWQAKPEARHDLGIAAQGLAKVFAAHGLDFTGCREQPAVSRPAVPCVSLVR